MVPVKVLDTKTSSAEKNMEIDGQLLEQLDPLGAPILHLYGWEDLSATYGYFIQPSEWFNLQKVAEKGVSLAKRPTGGGIIFHIWDLAFSFLMPSGHPAFSLNTLENYQFVNEVVLAVVKDFFSLSDSIEIIPDDFEPMGSGCNHFCMAKPTQYDVVYHGMKIAGAAQRRRKQGFLHQGTISLAFPDLELLEEILLSKEEVLQAMSLHSFSPLGKNCTKSQLDETRQELQKRLEEKFLEKLKSFE